MVLMSIKPMPSLRRLGAGPHKKRHKKKVVHRGGGSWASILKVLIPVAAQVAQSALGGRTRRHKRRVHRK